MLSLGMCSRVCFIVKKSGSYILSVFFFFLIFSISTLTKEKMFNIIIVVIMYEMLNIIIVGLSL